MPFIDDAPAAGLPALSPAPLDITPPPAPFSRLFDAALRRSNIIGSITEAATQPPMGAFDPSFDPWAKIEGYEDYARSFIGANNDDDVLHIKARIDKERRDEETLSTGGWRGEVARLAAGTLDPTMMIPGGGQVRAITRGGRALEGLIRGGAALGAGSALQETGLQGSQITRPVSESLINIGSATVLGGILGGAVGGLTRPTIQRLRELGDSAAVGGLVFDRELAANLPGRRPDDVVAEIIDAPMMERAIADTFAAGGDTAKVYDGLRARIERELADGAVVAHVDQGGERVPIVAIDRAGVLTDANGARLRLDEVTSPGHSIEIHPPAPEERLLVDDPLILHQRGELTAARAAEIASLPPEEVARLRAAGVPFDQEMWKVIAENLGKAEASREGGVSVVADQIGYLSAGGTSEREARAVIGRAMQAEASRGGDVARFLDDAYRQRGVAAPTTPGAVAAAAAPAARDTGAQAAALIGKPVPAMPAHRVATAGGQSVEVTPIVVEARDLVASSDAGYDSALQPRQRDRAASQQQVREIASRLDPERLGVSAEADRGAPIIGDDRMVESGNGRVMAIRAAYEENGPVAAAYREFLAKQGVDLAGFDQPVLVRQRTTPMSAKERADFAVAANRAATLQLSAPERAMADARNLTPDMLDLIRNPDNLEAVANRDFVRAFVESLPQAEQGAMTTAEGGLSAEGLGRIRHAILARAYGGTPDGAAILSRIAETTQDEIRSISNALTAAAPQWARLRGDIEAGRVVPEVDLTPELLEAVRRTADLRNRGQSFADFLRQGDAFDVLPPRVEEFMSLFYDVKGTRAAGAPRIADGLKDYAIEANKVSAEPGLDLGIPAVTADELQRRIVERTRGAGETGTLFGRERPDERVGGAGDGAGGAARGTEVRRPGVVEPGAGAGAAGETGAGRGEIGAGRERSAAAEAVTAPERPAAAGVIEQKQQLLDMHNQGAGAAGAPPPPGSATGGSVGAAKVLDTSLDQETIASALGVEKALVQSSPTLRAGTSPSIEVRRIAHDLADQPLDLKKNVEGIPTTQSVESLIKQFKAPLAEAEVGVDEAFVRYRLGRAKRPFDIARIEARDMFGRPQGAMSYGEFREAISHAMRRGDQSSEPEVAAAAKLLREKVFDPLKDRAIAAGLLSEDVEPKTALSYLMRIYDTNKIVAQRGQFSDVVTRWLSGEQAKKDTIRTRVTSLLGEHELLSSRAVPRVSRIAAIRDELEGLVKSWEGETSRAAKAALAQRAEQEATRTLEQGRLAAADQPVIDAAKAIANANTRLEEIELRDIARQIIDRIIGSPVGRLPYDMEVPHPSGGPPRPDRAAPRGPLAGRSFMIPDELIEPWLENDSRQIARAYNRTMAPDVLLAERFGRTDMEAQFQQVQAAYERLRAGKSEAEQIKLNAAMQADLRDLAAMRDRLRGTYGLPENPNGLANRVYHVIRDLNYLRLLGGMTMSAFPDMGRTVMVHGFNRIFGDALLPMLKDFHEFRVAANEAKLSGTALDMVLDTRAMSMADMLDDYGRWSKYERGLKGLTDKFGLVSLMAPWNSAMKQIVGVVGQTRTLEAVEALVAGQPLRQAERTRLASLGIGPDMAERIDQMFKTHGAKQDNGTWWANTAAWTDQGATEAFRSALNKEIDTAIVTQGQEIPLWMTKSATGRILSQFKSFSLASAQRVMMTGLQKRDMATLNGAVMMVGLGMVVYALRTSLNPKAQPLPDPSTPGGMARWIREGIDISGLTGWLFDVHNIVEKATGGGIGLSRLTGGSGQSKYMNYNTLDAVLGPTAGLIEDAGRLTGEAVKGTWSAGDSSRVRRMIPFQNLIGMRHLFDAAEHGLNHSLGIRERDKPGVNVGR